MSKIQIQIPQIFEPIFQPKRFKMLSGGRGSAKSESVGRALLTMASNHFERVLCGREYQNSIKESVHKMLCDIIDMYEMPNFGITKDSIKNTKTDSEFIFKGLKNNITSIKSFKGITKCWLEEAEVISEETLNILVPTIREPGSEIWATFNRYLEDDPIFKRFCRKEDSDVLFIHSTYADNPFFPDVLKKQMEKDKIEDRNLYLWVWEGEPLAQIDNAIISRHRVIAAEERTITAEGGVHLGVDVARFGDDKTVVYKRKGNKVITRKSLDKSSVDEVVDLVMSMANSKEDFIKVDDTGVGGGVTDYLRKNGYKNTIAVNNGENAKDKDKYDNAISEMWFEFASIIDEVDFPYDKELRKELTNRRFKYTSKAKRAVESKEEYKKRGNKSPDDGDALLLCFYNKQKKGFGAWSA